MLVDPIKPTLKAPGTMLLKLKQHESPSNVAFKINLRLYNEVCALLLKSHGKPVQLHSIKPRVETRARL